MMRTDSRGRSASPHRITYKSDFHAIKCSFDTGNSLQTGTKTTCAHSNNLLTSLSDPLSHTSSPSNRGRVPSTRGTKIRENIFLQMDSQQMKQDGVSVLSSGSTSIVSPYNVSCQAHVSPFCGSRRSFVSSSSVMSAVANISAESCLQDRLSRSEEKVDVDRAALAQKFSVTRRLFETKVMEREEVGGSATKGITGRGSKGMTDGKAEEKEWGGAVSQTTTHAQEESDSKQKSSKNIPLPKLDVQAALTGYHKTPIMDGPDLSCHHDEGSHGVHEEIRSATLDLCSAPEDPLRAELVDVKNESSESDENEEGKVQEETKTMPEIEHGKNMNIVAGEEEQDFVDDVFEESSMENEVALRADESNSMVQFEEHQQESLCEMETNDGEHGGGVYWQVNEQWIGQSRQSTEKAEMSTETGECRETDRERDAMQDEASDQEEEHADEEAKHEDDQTGSTLGCGAENEAFGNEQESHSPQPEASTPPRQEGESCVHAKHHLSLEYEEIPGVPEVVDEEPAMVARRKVRFSPAPIKVNKIFVIFTISCL